jgi:hypothetical protein
MGAPPKMILQPPIRKAVLVGTIMTIAGAVFSFALPNTPNYLLLPGMLAVYMATGGVHGDSSGMHLPSLPVWYALGGVIDLLIYALGAFWVLEILRRRRGKGSL